MTLEASVTLSNGPHGSARVRPVTGHDEAEVAEAAAGGNSLLPAERATLLLARCVTSLGEAPPRPEDLRALSVGDRERLLLHVRRVSLGERVQCVLTCPAEGCGEKLDVDLAVGDLLAPPAAAAEHEADVDVPGARLRVRFRLPTGADQEEAARIAARDEAAAAERLLRSCVLAVTDRDTGAPVPDWPAGLADALGPRVAEADPQSEVVLDVPCPACGRGAPVLFDAAAFLLEELTQRGRRLYREVHVLASRYHWSERDILSMSARRRALYLRLLDEDARGEAA